MENIEREPDSIKRTQEFWRKKRGLKLTSEEARKLNRVVTDYFRILYKLNKEIQSRKP